MASLPMVASGGGNGKLLLFCTTRQNSGMDRGWEDSDYFDAPTIESATLTYDIKKSCTVTLIHNGQKNQSGTGYGDRVITNNITYPMFGDTATSLKDGYMVTGVTLVAGDTFKYQKYGSISGYGALVVVLE